MMNTHWNSIEVIAYFVQLLHFEANVAEPPATLNGFLPQMWCARLWYKDDESAVRFWLQLKCKYFCGLGECKL